MKDNVVKILLADDDKDDRFLFRVALQSIKMPVCLNTVCDGEELINYLNEHSTDLPDILFLDLNMPKKNGFECLSEIKSLDRLNKLKVVIYSTSLDETMADELYRHGALFYIQKTDLDKLQEMLKKFLPIIEQTREQPAREKFLLPAS